MLLGIIVSAKALLDIKIVKAINIDLFILNHCKRSIMYKIVVISTLSMFLIACGNSNSNTTPKPRQPETELRVMKSQFSSMNKCMKSIKKSSHSSLNIVTNKPEEISGFLGKSNELGFSCAIKETGTDGIFVEGWYMVREEI